MKYVSLFLFSLSFSLYSQTTLDVGQFLNVRTGKMIKNARLTIDLSSGKILKISTKDKSGQATYNFPNVTLIPGLIDTHTHLCLNDQSLDGGFDRELEREVRTSMSERLGWGRSHGQDLLKSGFTLIRNLGNCGEWGEKILSEEFEKMATGPTLFYSGKGLSAPGGQFFIFTDPELVSREYLVVRDERELVKAITEVKASGATWLKLYADNDPNPQIISPELLIKAVKISRKLGLSVAIHAIKSEAIDHAIAARPDSIEHGVELNTQQIQQIKKAKIFLVMTDLAGELRSLFYTFTFDWNRSFHETAPFLLNSRARVVKRNELLMAFGSDYYFDLRPYGYSFGQGTLAALLGLQTQAFSPFEMIQMATWKAAFLLGKSEQYGEIAPGFYADLVALRGNPLDYPDYLRNPVFVMKKGKMINPNL